jgi:phosphoserine/homoserine phosphotransferase
MLGAAHAGFWFHAPDSIKAQFPQFPATDTYDELFDAITGAL